MQTPQAFVLQYLPVILFLSTIISCALIGRRWRCRWMNPKAQWRQMFPPTTKKMVICALCIFVATPSVLSTRFVVEKFRCCTILTDLANVSQSESRVQLIVATPGSGSDYCRISIASLTGLLTGSVYDLMNLTMTDKLPYLPLYYKTHFPFIPSVGPIDDYINLNPERVVVLIRDPFDAAFSEWIRQKVSLVNIDIDNKYNQVNEIISQKDFLVVAEGEGNIKTPSTELTQYMEMYLDSWRNFHRYWLSDFSGKVKVVLYQQLVDDILRFKEIASFFGYETDSTTERKERLQCFLNNVEKTKYRKRPFSASVEETKDVVRKYFESKTKDARDYVEMLYKLKYNRTLVIP